MGRSLLAVFGGWILIQMLVLGADEILMRVFPGRYGTGLPMPDWMTGLRLACGTLFTVAGGWLTARLAPERPWRHALYLIVLGESMGLVLGVASLGQLPLWYLGGLLVLFPLAVLAGAWLRTGSGGARGAGSPAP
jgi:hypothetical protein